MVTINLFFFFSKQGSKDLFEFDHLVILFFSVYILSFIVLLASKQSRFNEGSGNEICPAGNSTAHQGGK